MERFIYEYLMAIYRDLSDIEIQQLDDALTRVDHAINGIAGDVPGRLQRWYDALIEAEAPDVDEIELLGYAFARMLLAEDWLHWAVLVDSDYGDEVAVAIEDLEIGCTPLSMIANRIEDREAWDLAELCESTIRQLRQLGQDAAVRES